MLDDAPVDRSGTYFRVASFFAEQGYTSANFRAFPYDWRESVDDQIIVGRLDEVLVVRPQGLKELGREMGQRNGIRYSTRRMGFFRVPLYRGYLETTDMPSSTLPGPRRC